MTTIEGIWREHRRAIRAEGWGCRCRPEGEGLGCEHRRECEDEAENAFKAGLLAVLDEAWDGWDHEEEGPDEDIGRRAALHSCMTRLCACIEALGQPADTG